MEIILILNNEEKEKVLHTILCDGLSPLNSCGLDIKYSDKSYSAARKIWIAANPDKSPCREDILLQVIKDGKFTIVDLEGEGEHTKKLTLDMLDSIKSERAVGLIMNILDENGDYDAWDAFNTLQYILYGELVFG
jgi:hypothetical protein